MKNYIKSKEDTNNINTKTKRSFRSKSNIFFIINIK